MRHQTRLRSQMQTTERRGFTVVELLVSIAIIGLIVSLLLPAVQQARETSRKAQCQNNLRQLGLAMHEHDGSFSRLPALGYMGLDSKGAVTPFFGWTQRILPFVEQGNLYQKWDFNQPLYDPVNQATATTPVPVFRCPSDHTVVGKGDLSYVVNGGYGWTIALSGAIDCTIGYPSLSPIDINGNGILCPLALGPDGSTPDRELLIRTGAFFLESWKVLGIDRHHTLDTFVDGQSQTILITENIRAGYDPLDSSASWGTADPLRMGFFLTTDICNGGSCSPANFSQAVANATNGINSGLNQPEGRAPWPSSMHHQGVNICLADGSVRFISENMSSIVYYALVTSQGSLFQSPLADEPSAMGAF